MNTKNTALFLFLMGFYLWSTGSQAQYQYEVSTLIPTNSNQIDDGLCIDPNGVVYGSFWGIWGGRNGEHVLRFRPNGNIDTLAEGFTRPNGLSFHKGRVIVANSGGNSIFAIDTATGLKTLLANPLNPSSAIFVPGTDSLLSVSYFQNNLVFNDSLGNQILLSNSSKLNGPAGLCFDLQNNLYVGNFDDGKILKYDGAGDFNVIADVGGGTGFITYSDSALLATNHVNKRVYRIPLDGSPVEVIAGSGQAIVADGIGTAASFAGPNGIVASKSGDTIYVSEFMPKTLRMIIRRKVSSIENLGKEVKNPFFYPNPASGLVKLNDAYLNQFLRVKIYNESASLIDELELNPQNQKGEIKINLVNGTYFFSVFSEDGSHIGVQRISITH